MTVKRDLDSETATLVNYAVSHIAGVNKGSQQEFKRVISLGMIGKSATKSLDQFHAGLMNRVEQ
jgi:hypothetical protein